MPTIRYAFSAIILAIGVASSGAHAQGTSSPNDHKPKSMDKMNKDRPMPTPMSRPGMMKGDVKKGAEKKEKTMQPMLEKEEKDMTKHPSQQSSP